MNRSHDLVHGRIREDSQESIEVESLRGSPAREALDSLFGIGGFDK
jgi:hypothetical protein